MQAIAVTSPMSIENKNERLLIISNNNYGMHGAIFCVNYLTLFLLLFFYWAI